MPGGIGAQYPDLMACRAEARSEAKQARLRVASRRYAAASFACIHERRMVAQICPRWNRVADWLREAEWFSTAA
jgi:hypothetical protein